MTTSGGTMRNYGWVWSDGGDVYVGTSEWENGVNATTQVQYGGIGALTIQDNANLTCSTFVTGADGGTATITLSGSGNLTTRYDAYLGNMGDPYGNVGISTMTMSNSSSATIGGRFALGQVAALASLP